MKKSIFALILFLGCCVVFHFAFQNPSIYFNTLNKVSKNWINNKGDRYLGDQPYQAVTNENIIQWDALHYNTIRNNFYNTDVAGGDFIYAFFPLFPVIWKLSFLPPAAIPFFNFLLFSIGLLLLLSAISVQKLKYELILISLTLPGLINFLIPYTEATFFICLSLGVYGLLKNNYKLYFIAMCFAAMARPSVTILLLAFAATEGIYFFQHRSILNSIKQLFYKVAPLIIGTLVVCLFQLYHGSGQLLKFVQAQSFWDHTFRIPHNLSDWSHESFGMSLLVLLSISIPLLVGFIIFTLKKLYNKSFQNFSDLEYLQTLSFIFIIGTTLYIVFFQGGSLNGLYRYVLCTPFFYLLFFSMFGKIEIIRWELRAFILFTFLLIGIFCLGLIPYSTNWNFSDLGFFLLAGTLCLWTFQDLSNYKFYKVILFLLIGLNTIWTSYLFNTYISNSWIFT